MLACAAAAAATVSTAGAGPAPRYFTDHTGLVPPCDDPWALGRIAGRFAQKESWFWSSSAAIVELDRVREIAYRPWGPTHVPRRYCKARALISDGRKTEVYYSIIERGGFAGIGSGVEWCVVGYDRNLAYAPRCKVARP